MPNIVRDFVGLREAATGRGLAERGPRRISLVLNFEEGAERTPLYGDKVVIAGEGNVLNESRRDLLGESIFDYGSRVAFWRLMDLFDRYDVKATVFACGMALEHNPEAAREFIARGHEPVAHGYRYAPMYTFTRDEEREQIRRAIEAFQKTRASARTPGTAPDTATTPASWWWRRAASPMTATPTRKTFRISCSCGRRSGWSSRTTWTPTT